MPEIFKDHIKGLLLDRCSVSVEAVKKWDPQLNAAAGANEILIYGPIVSDEELAFYQYFFENADEMFMSGKLFREKLAGMSGTVLVRFNSPGGDYWELSTIVGAIDERGEVNGIVDGLAASAASVVLAVCEKTSMARLADVMIHEPQSWAFGPSDLLRKTADRLDSIRDRVLKIYDARMSVGSKKLAGMLKEETWLGADEAKKAGLIDEIVTPKKDEKKDDSSANVRLMSLVTALQT